MSAQEESAQRVSRDVALDLLRSGEMSEEEFFLCQLDAILDEWGDALEPGAREELRRLLVEDFSGHPNFEELVRRMRSTIEG